MAEVRATIENGRGERVVWIETATSSGGEVVAMEVWVEPGPEGPPPHIHLQQEEQFTVLAGSLALRTGRERRVLSAGEVAVIPAGTSHTWRNDGQEILHAHVKLRPALDFEHFQEALFWLLRNDKMNARSIANLLQTATVIRHHLGQNRLAAPPQIIQRALLSVLAAIGRRAGYTAQPGR